MSSKVDIPFGTSLKNKKPERERGRKESVIRERIPSTLYPLFLYYTFLFLMRIPAILRAFPSPNSLTLELVCKARAFHQRLRFFSRIVKFQTRFLFVSLLTWCISQAKTLCDMSQIQPSNMEDVLNRKGMRRVRSDMRCKSLACQFMRLDERLGSVFA